MVSAVGKLLQRFAGFRDGDGVRDSSVYLENHTLTADVVGQGVAAPAFVVRGLNAQNAPTELFRVNKDGTIVPAAGGGVDLATADARYVNATGDAMTGDLALPNLAATGALGTTAGRVLLGPTAAPAWGANDYAVDFDGGKGAVFLRSNGNVYLGKNITFDGSSYRATADAPAVLYSLTAAGTITWANAPAPGAAGAVPALATRMMLTAAGQVGVGGTPKAWDTPTVIDLAAGFGAFRLTGRTVQVLANAYYDTAYRNTGAFATSSYQQLDGVHTWYADPSPGAAGTSFTPTERMRIAVTGAVTIPGGLAVGANAVAVDPTAGNQLVWNAAGFYVPAGGGGVDLATGDARWVNVTGDAMSGDLSFTGTGRRIGADFTNATHASRAMLQTSTANGATNVGLLPNGSGASSALYAYAGSNADVATYARLLVDATAAVVDSARSHPAAPLVPLDLRTDNTTKLRVHVSGGVSLLGTTDPGVGKARIDGNTGVNVTPQTWSGLTALQVGPQASLAGFFSGNGGLWLGRNQYYDGASWRAITADAAETLYVVNRSFSFQTAPSPGAGGVLTFTTHMTLDTTGLTLPGAFAHTGASLGFYSTSPVAKPTVSGSKGGNAALGSLMTALAGLGLLTDSTT